MTTTVECTFVAPTGLPISNSSVEFQASKSSYIDALDGVVMPRAITLLTDSLGKCTIELWPSPIPYYVLCSDNLSTSQVFYKILVPETAPGITLRMQDLIIEVIPPVVGGGTASLADGVYGDVTVSGSGTVISVNSGAISLAEMASLVTKTYLGRTNAATGAPEAVPVATLKADLGLTNVNDTADADKPISTLQAAALLLKVDASALSELIDDRVAALLTQGANMTITYNDATGQIVLAAAGVGGGSTLADGDYGDVTVSGSGTVITIGAGTVSLAKLASIPTKTYMGRTSAATGVPEAVSVATLKSDLVLVKADVGLSSVDNTADSTKPVSTPQQTALDLKANISLVGANSGIAPLDGSGKVPSANLPSYVDDVLEYANLAAFPGTGETGKVYIRLDTNAQYRWTGSVYVQLTASPGTTDAVPEGSTNLYHTPARVIAAPLTGLSTATSTDVVAADSVLVGVGKLQGKFGIISATVRAVILTGIDLGTNAAVAATDSVMGAIGKLSARLEALITTVSGKQAALVSGTNLRTVNGQTLLGATDLVISSGAPTRRDVAGTTDTIVVGDSNNLVYYSNTGAIAVGVGVAFNGLGTSLIFPAASGAITLTPTGGATLNGSTSAMTFSSGKGSVSLVPIGTNAWITLGADGELLTSDMTRAIGTTVSASRALASTDFGKTTPVDTSGGAVVLTHNTGTVSTVMQPAFFQRRGANTLTVVAGTGTVAGTVTLADGEYIAVIPDPITANKVALA